MARSNMIYANECKHHQHIGQIKQSIWMHQKMKVKNYKQKKQNFNLLIITISTTVIQMHTAHTDIYKKERGQQAQTTVIKKGECLASINTCQPWWESAAKGKRTFSFILNISLWTERDEISRDFVQFLSGHGCFWKYLHRFRHVSPSVRPHSVEAEENADHAIFNCLRSVASLDEHPHNASLAMAENLAIWNTVSKL